MVFEKISRIRYIYSAVVFMLMTAHCYAGIEGYGGIVLDLGMMADRPQVVEYTIPYFYSEREARQFGDDMKGVEPMRLALEKELKKIPPKSLKYMFCKIAFDIMDSYPHKDQAMHSRHWKPIYYDIPYFKDYKDAFMWVNTNGWNTSKIHYLRLLAHGYLELAKKLPDDATQEQLHKAALNVTQSDICRYAFLIMINMRNHGMQPDQAQNVGNSFYAGEEPVFNHGVFK